MTTLEGAALVTKDREPRDRPAETAPALGFEIRDPQRFARNMAQLVQEAGQVATAWIHPRLAKPGHFRADHVAPLWDAALDLQRAWLLRPDKAFALQVQLWRDVFDLWSAFGLALLRPERADRGRPPDPQEMRFTDPGWSDNRYFDFLKQAYLVTSRWAERLVEEAEGLDPRARHKAGFYMTQILNAIAPSNWVFTNPELLRATFASDGENLVRGMQLLAEDIRKGDGQLKIRHSDPSHFEVGKTLAITPGKVTYQNPLMQLIQYAPSTEQVLKRPLLIVPPWINKYYILDLTPEKSLVGWLVDQGHTVFIISWVNPDETLADKSFEDYMREGVLAALDAIHQATGERTVNALGYCVGGTLLAATLAYLAAKRDTRIKSATFLAAQVDFEHAGDLRVFTDEKQVAAIEREMVARGYFDSSGMATAFNLLRSNDLIWPYIVNVYLKGEAPLPFDLLFWNADSTRVPAANHSFYLRHCYINNDLSQGRMRLGGVTLDLAQVTIPIYHLATREDHIAPARSVFHGASFFGGPVRLVLAGSGHIAGVVNPPARRRYSYWTNGPPEGSLETWLARADEHEGSWWPDCHAWMASLDQRRVPARPVGAGQLAPIEPAPGSYVRQ